MATQYRSPIRWRDHVTWRGLAPLEVDARYVARAPRRPMTAARARRTYRVVRA